jgi:hypothetical protein
MLIPSRTRLVAPVLALFLAACAGSSPTSPSPSAGGTGAVIEGTVIGGAAQASAGVSAATMGAMPMSVARPLAASSMTGLTVQIVGTNLSAVVGESGTFRMTDVPAGTVRLRFTKDGVNATVEIANVTDDQFIQIQVEVSATSAVILDEARLGKVTLCHAEGTGDYHFITVSEDAEGSHRDHGDGEVGDPVPGQTGKTFDENCQPAGPSIEIEKSTNGEDADSAPGPEVEVGSPVAWEYRLTNTGTLNLTGIVVGDDQGVTVTCSETSLAPEASMTCTGAGVAVLGQYSNVGTATANWTSPTGTGTVTDTDVSHYLGVLPEEEEEGEKVTLCHRTGAGVYVKVDVGASAVPAHIAHGDGKVGDAIPGMPGKVFSSGCTAQ